MSRHRAGFRWSDSRPTRRRVDVSNTIRFPRARPRVRSFSFRTLGWLLRREASYLVVCYPPPGVVDQRERRRWARWQTRTRCGVAWSVIRRFPERAVYP